LRRRLAHYYKDNGLNDPLVIDIPKGGYAPRFSEPATPKPESARIPQIAGEAESSVPIRPTAPVAQPARKWIALLTLGLVFVLFVWWRGEGETSVPVELPSPFIMVMPMAHQGSAIGRQTADRSVQAVISKLAKLDSISVMAYRSSIELAADSPSLTRLRADQSVSHVLDGQLEIQLDEVHAQMEIVATDTGEAVWSENIVGKLSAMSDFEALLSGRIAAALSVTLDPDQNERLYLHHSHNLEALDLFRYAIRAIYPPDKARIAVARHLFQRVTELDPEFSGGYAGLSLTYSYTVLFENSNSPQQDLEKAIAYAEKSIAVDPGFGMDVAILSVAHTLKGDIDQGLTYTHRAIGLEPGEPLSHQWLALSLIRSGRPQEGITAIKEALRLDPRDPQMPYLCILGMLHFAIGNSSQAIAAFEEDQLRGIRRGLYVYAMQAAAYAELGNEKAARALIPALNADLIAQEFPVEQWIGGMLTNQEQLQQALSELYRLGMLRPEQRVLTN
jgi:tetratricopeptide (TPR) repeat protein